MFKKYVFEGKENGPNILILGAVHGNETAGTFAQQEIIQELSSKPSLFQKGRVTFIPIVNEAAQKKDVRGVDENLNRVIKYHDNPVSNEEKIANLLCTEIKEADILLDLHSTHCEKDKPFAFIDHPTEKNLNFLNIIPVETALAGWPEIYQNQPEIENNSTEEFAFLSGTQALTVECGYHKSEKSIQTAKKAILNTLRHFGVLNGEKPLPVQKEIIHLKNFVIKEKEGKLAKDFVHLDPVTKNEVIAVYEDGKTVSAPFDGFIIMPNKEATQGAEWFYFGKKD